MKDCNCYQCDQIMAETPNRDVLGVKMSLIFGKCRLSFFVAFKAKRAFFLAFLIFGRFYPIFASFFKEIHSFSFINFPFGALLLHFNQHLQFSSSFLVVFHKNPIFWNNQFETQHPGYIDFIPYLMLGVFEDLCRLKKAFWKKPSGHTGHERRERAMGGNSTAAGRILHLIEDNRHMHTYLSFHF